MAVSLDVVYERIYIPPATLQEAEAMNFRSVTDELLVHPTLEDLADALGVSVQAIRQARSKEGSKAFRSPPEGWEDAALWLTENTIAHFERLARKLRNAVRVKKG
jgi:hypothetical protein